MILVIGGTGKVGIEVVKQLAQAKVKARVLVRDTQKEAEIKKLGLETALGDVTKPDTITAALKDVEKVFLLLPASLQQVEQEISVIDAAKKSGAMYVVLVSALGAHPSSPLTLAQQHAKVEDYLKSSGLAYTILQPHSFMQNLLGQTGAIKSQGAIYGNFKDGKVAMVDTRDIAAVAVACLTQGGHEGQTYLITGPQALSQAEVAEKLSTIIGKNVKYIDVPTDQTIKAMTSFGMSDWLAKDLGKIGEVFAAGYGSTTADTVEKVTKKKPVDFDQFVKDHAQAFK